MQSGFEDVAHCTYERFEVWLSCEQKAAVLSMAEIAVDKGSENTSNRNYFLDESAAALSCQQTSDDSYASHHKGFDVGDLIAIDHFDDNKSQALQTNTMVNMVPQATSFNRNGAWKKTESLTECYRDDEHLAPLSVYAGAIYGNNASNDFYTQSHGLPETPDFLWKLIYSRKANQYDIWVMANSNASKAATLPSSRRTIASLMKILADEKEAHYQPVIEILSNIKALSPEHIEIKNNPRCRRRIG